MEAHPDPTGTLTRLCPCEGKGWCEQVCLGDTQEQRRCRSRSEEGNSMDHRDTPRPGRGREGRGSWVGLHAGVGDRHIHTE